MVVCCNRHIAWGLLLVITLPVLGMFAWLQAEKYAVRKEVKHLLMEHIERDALVKLSFHEDEIQEVLRWEHAGEFEYRHTMYDIVEQVHAGDSITYWCWEDSKESALNRQLAALTDQWLGHAPERQNQKEHIQRFLRQLYHDYTDDALVMLPIDTEDMAKPYCTELTWVHQELSTPPPRQ